MQNSIFMVQSANFNNYFAIFSQVSQKKIELDRHFWIGPNKFVSMIEKSFSSIMITKGRCDKVLFLSMKSLEKYVLSSLSLYISKTLQIYYAMYTHFVNKNCNQHQHTQQTYHYRVLSLTINLCESFD